MSDIGHTDILSLQRLYISHNDLDFVPVGPSLKPQGSEAENLRVGGWDLGRVNE